MSAIDYMKSNAPPPEMVAFVFNGLGIIDPGPATKLFATLACAGFTNWLKQDHGQVWSYLINGAHHERPGPWEDLSLLDGDVAHKLPSDKISIWKRGPRVTSIDHSPVNSGEFVGYVISRMSSDMKRLNEPTTPLEVVRGRFVHLPTAIVALIPASIPTPAEAVSFIASATAHAAATWMLTEIGQAWMFVGGPLPPSDVRFGDRIQQAIADICGETSLLQSLHDLQETIFAYRGTGKSPLSPIVMPLSVVRTVVPTNHYCEECGERQPCITIGRDRRYLCQRCAGYTYSGGNQHDTCSTCDRSPEHAEPCSHWPEFFQYAGNQRLLPAPR